MSDSNTPKERIDTSINYYAILGLEPTASLEEIRRAYKKKALLVHPDRNPDDPDAADKFEQVNKAHFVLTNSELKAELDAQFEKRRLEHERLEKLGEKKRLLREYLERREQEARRASYKPAATNFPSGHAAPMRRDAKSTVSGGYDQLYKYMEQFQREYRAAAKAAAAAQEAAYASSVAKQSSTDDDDIREVKVKWKKADVGDAKLGENELRDIFDALFGKVDRVIKKPKSRSAIISFKSADSARKAADFANWGRGYTKFSSVKLLTLEELTSTRDDEEEGTASSEFVDSGSSVQSGFNLYRDEETLFPMDTADDGESIETETVFPMEYPVESFVWRVLANMPSQYQLSTPDSDYEQYTLSRIRSGTASSGAFG